MWFCECQKPINAGHKPINWCIEKMEWHKPINTETQTNKFIDSKKWKWKWMHLENKKAWISDHTIQSRSTISSEWQIANDKNKTCVPKTKNENESACISNIKQPNNINIQMQQKQKEKT